MRCASTVIAYTHAMAGIANQGLGSVFDKANQALHRLLYRYGTGIAEGDSAIN